MPYATSTPNANEAITAHTNINEPIANLPRSLSNVIVNDLAYIGMINLSLSVA
jgi:hypothetical protein